MPPKQTTEGPQAEPNPQRAEPQSVSLDVVAEMFQEMRSLRIAMDASRTAMESNIADVADLSMRLAAMERAPDRRINSMYDSSDPYTTQDARSGVRASTHIAQGQHFLPPRRVEPEPLPDRLATPQGQFGSRLEDRDRSLPHDRSLSERLNDRNIPDSDRAQILEEDWERSRMQDQKVDSDALWRAAYEIVRRDEPGITRAEAFRKAKQIANEQLLKSALDARPQTRKTEGSEHLVSFQGIQKVTALSQDTYDAWVNDLWSFLGSNLKARSMLFSDSSLGYDRKLDEAVGGLLGLTVDAHYKATTIAKLRSLQESRGTVIFVELCKDANRDSEARKNLLRQRMRTTIQKSSEGVQAYSERLNTIFLSLGNIDKTFTESERVDVLLGNLNASYASMREAIDGGQFASQRKLSYNETVSFLLTQEEKRSLRSLITPAQPLGRFNARHTIAEDVMDTPTDDDCWSPDEDEVRAFMTQFHKYRSKSYSGRQSGPPADHQAATTWFPGECNFCHNIGHRGAHCRMRAKLLDDAGAGPKYEMKGSARLAAGDNRDRDEVRHAEAFPGDDRVVEARNARVLASNLE
ncbi:hypothetical protein CF319_g2807 [Tilletia indica]|nr:hypothetical protein CF319_g2807 [Tilletia indica]KAE8227978.1 hypothetical protein CF326_g7107 [Tilletia indica]